MIGISKFYSNVSAENVRHSRFKEFMNIDLAVAVFSALLLGSLVGVERQWHRRLVDLKTNALVALGACLFVWTCNNGLIYQDTVRMVGQIVVGVGFIGGGLLFRDGSVTKGINTATTIWCCAAVGAFCGLGRWQEALFSSLVIVVANTVLRKVAHQLNLKMGVNDYLVDTIHFELECLVSDAHKLKANFEQLIKQNNCEIRSFALHQKDLNTQSLSYSLAFDQDKLDEKIHAFIETLVSQGVSTVKWSR
jgi:putative Mg2+ transporter-C (MgtC) family protein